ncbi:MAG: RHS repeat-associated core domain-containing protein, partial [Bacilli bacterium]
DENYVINYYYDSSDNVIGFEYNNNKYLYLKNLQNDIIGIVDETGNLVVEYTYDAYGNIIKLVDTSNCDLSTVNPFRYRSYYYDKETGWYYLNSRYYDPLVKRFITMDSVEYSGSNMFKYCNNNPIMYVDFDGCFPKSVLDLVNRLSAATIFAQYASMLYTSFAAGLAKIGAYITGILLPKVSAIFWCHPWLIAGIIVTAVALVVSTVVILYNKAIANSISSIGSIARSHTKEKYECKEAALEMKDALIKKKQKGALVSLSFPNVGNQYVYSMRYGDSFPISKNGMHWGVLFEGKVYCTIYPEGISETGWKSSFYTPYGTFPIYKKIPW